MGIDIYILLNNLNLNIGKTNGYNNEILVSNTDLKIGLNRDINRNHKKLTPPNVSNTLEKLQSARNKWNKDRMKQLDFINKRLLEKIRPGHTSIMLIKQCLSTIEYLQKKKKNPLPLEPELSDFYLASEAQIMVNYYLLQWIQALQHMLHTSTLNK